MVVELASISIAVAYGEEFPSTLDGLVELDLLDFIAPAWRTRNTVEVGHHRAKDSLLVCDTCVHRYGAGRFSTSVLH
jgi:hypothetical protein